MATREVTQDNQTGRLTLNESASYRLLGLLQLAGGLVLLIFGFTRASGDAPALLFALVMGLGFGCIGAYLAFGTDTVIVDPQARTVVHTSRFLFLQFDSAMLPFSDIAQIEVKYYYQSSGRGGGHQAWKVKTINRDGTSSTIDADGGRDEMLDLGQQIATLIGVPLLDHSHSGPTLLDKIMGREGDVQPPDPDPSAPATAPASDSSMSSSSPDSTGVASAPAGPQPVLADPAPIYGSAFTNSTSVDTRGNRTALIVLAVVSGVVIMGLIVAVAAWSPTH